MSGIDYSLLYSFGSSGNTSDLFSTIYGGASTPTAGTTSVSTGDPILDLKLAEQNQTKGVAREAKDPGIIRDLAGFTKGVATAKDAATALKNPQVLKVLLTANGLSDQIAYPALASKVLLSNPSDPKSLVNTISDTRWKAVVKSYNLATTGLAGLKNATTQSQIATAYERVSWLNSLNTATPGLAQALQFKQNASQITNVDQILGDATNRAVVLGALGIPLQIAFQELPAQERAVTDRLNLARLKDPKFVNTLTDRYLLSKQQSNQGGTQSTASGILGILA